jgi:chlorite dismutase
MPEPPQTDEGWYVLHDFRSVDWDDWRDASDRERQLALDDGEEYLAAHEAVSDAAAGDSAVFSVLGHKADLLIVHFRPTLDALSAAERRFEGTAFAGFTTQTSSYVSVTEVSGYVSDDYFGDGEVDAGLERYIQDKLHPEIPADTYVSFYPMSKRRGEQHNWYTLEFDERVDMMAEHGDTGREFAGDISQVIASSVGFDDHEWGVTLFGDDPTDIKDIVYEMRFDEASAKYGEFGQFYVGRRFPPADLPAYMDGESVPTGEGDEGSGGSQGHPHADDAHGGGPPGDHGGDTADDIRGELADLDVYAGSPHGEDVHAVALYSEADPDELFDELSGLRDNFEHYDRHIETAQYATEDGDRLAVVSLWEAAEAAETAAGFLSELPGIVERVEVTDGFGTMGMFYTVKPEYREEFVERFGDVAGLLDDMEGHRQTALLVNREDETDMFIASEWASKEDAMAFFRSDDFRETVQWGRDVLADRPRHVFLA